MITQEEKNLIEDVGKKYAIYTVKKIIEPMLSAVSASLIADGVCEDYILKALEKARQNLLDSMINIMENQGALNG